MWPSYSYFNKDIAESKVDECDVESVSLAISHFAKVMLAVRKQKVHHNSTMYDAVGRYDNDL